MGLKPAGGPLQPPLRGLMARSPALLGLGVHAPATPRAPGGPAVDVLVTAGNTLALIDKVRCITNIFTGRTGAAIALEAHRRGHAVTLVTSHAEAVVELAGDPPPGPERWSLVRYRTFEDLQGRMESAIRQSRLDGVIHCAAVSDYLSAGVFAPAEGTRFDPASHGWVGDRPGMVGRLAGKVK